ncbi:AraC family transcriptional regulator, partial [Pseudomonas aeruginosa]|nr:AraC family transcriptional regulator [Pseudomonas aeruginosa]
MQEKDSVAVYFVQTALHGLHPQRVAAVLAEAGIDPQLLGDSKVRVAASAFAKLWLA